MGSGRGKGADQTGALAAGCCAIYCMVCFFVVGLPMLIAGIVLIRFGEGDYDDQYTDSLTDCVKDNFNDCAYGYNCDNTCTSWEDWENTKDVLKIIGIVFVVLSLISLVAGLLLIVLMFTSLCKSGGAVHQTQQVPMQTQPAVYAYNNQGAYPQQPSYGQPGNPQQGYPQPAVYEPGKV